MQTIKETIENLHGSLSDYIEATYHISAPSLIAQRQHLLERDGIIHRVPYLESTPKYQTGDTFGSMVGLPSAAQTLFSRLSSPSEDLPRLIYDPPYKHQAESLRHNLIDGKNLVIMTGTGSGKTESFLLPILGKFAQEAQTRPSVFAEQPAMRALIMYPMNALVNDQLGRLRALLGDPRLVSSFKEWCGRPPRFARYTSRTPYAGIRTSKKDSSRLQSFDSFYVDVLRRAESEDAEEKAQAVELLTALKDRGKWPAKPDLEAWFGQKGSAWQDRKTGEFVRAVTLPDDSELLTRHEVHAAPPDLLVTNYSMLEYMLMRPIERPIFDRTREWLADNPDETFLVVLDEAHLYRGAAGAEVGLLLRRLRDRIGVPEDRFRIICATASFKDADYAPAFGSQLSGIPADTFVPIEGTLDLKEGAGKGTLEDAEALSGIDLNAFYEADTDDAKLALITPLLDYRGVTGAESTERGLFDALKSLPAMCALINATMKEARPIAELGTFLFAGDVPAKTADEAVTVLMALGSVARPEPNLPGLLPCRIHNFFRGLPGLWVCMDPGCSELSEDQRDGICGKMCSQPSEECGCGARVLELFTCRNCGTAYARAYTDDVDSPRALWSEPGEQLRMASGETSPLLPIDLLLEQPAHDDGAEPADYDLETGQLNPLSPGPRMRTVFIRQDRLTDTADDENENDTGFESRGQFTPCAVCGKTARFGRSYVQDHQTKGDQPFQALLARQIQIQPPGPKEATPFAPLRGRKVLAFSDSRQVAARLAPNLQMYSERDSLRPLIISGFNWLKEQNAIRPHLNLDDLYFGVLLASKRLNVRLRPEMRGGENFDAEEVVDEAVRQDELEDPSTLLSLLLEIRAHRPPESLLSSMLTTLTDRFWGMEPLALATLKESDRHTKKILGLPPIPGFAENDEAKLAIARYWLRCWNNNGFRLAQMPGTWINRPPSEGFRVKPRNPKAKIKAIESVIDDKAARKVFWDSWSPELLKWFTQSVESGYRCLNGSELSLQFDGAWMHCSSCKSVHRPIPGIESCLDCGSDTVSALDPDADPVFLARKGFYRKPVTQALEDPPRQPMALIAAEHTAQLNAPQNEDVFSKAEENELLFQDIALSGSGLGGRSTAIDILSSTTTMEVGIDLGALSGVALRNMPPGRANYQQRAGRAGRRGNAVATVVAFGSADTHDEHYFSQPDEMIRGDVVDPKLTLDNPEIVRRHIRAFLLQNYHQDRLPIIDPDQPHDLFSVLGSVSGFRKADSLLNRDDFAAWLADNEETLRTRIAGWIPEQLSGDDRALLLGEFVSDCLQAVGEAIAPGPGEEDETEDDDDADTAGDEEAAEEGEEHPQQASSPGKMLDRLLYCGKLPRYAFPTDVATFNVFDRDRSSRHRHIMKFAPSQGLPIALSQYAPDKQVWIAGKCYTSGAIYSVMKDDRFHAWESKRLYMECSDCGFARTFEAGEIVRNDTTDCEACGGENTFGPARYWMRPPGFAHPIGVEEMTSPDEIPETSYATRAKLTMGTPGDDEGWSEANERIRSLKTRRHLLVSNTGPQQEGYNYCVKCGRIEASNTPSPILAAPHRKPYPDDDDKLMCDGIGPTRHLVLGTDFITDIALFSMRVAAPLKLKPGHYSTDVALRTVSEALAKAACQILEIEPGELMAEYRPALTPAGKSGLEAEIFLYDTLPGGAGFASQFADRGLELFQRALQLLKTCPEDCDASCYRCLRSFKNKFEHRLLDRHVGAELLEYLLTGLNPGFSAERLKRSTALLLNDLLRRDEGMATFEAGLKIAYGNGKSVTAPILAECKGRKFVIALSGPLTTGHPADPAIAEFRDSGTEYQVIVENELVIRGNLPTATRTIYQQITG
ncbi:DEAD/DEAH box helicase [Cucumibacter marinus]|uniref:DEAD/DEAH box helicase n=1 Tax=Cucumibacter marinus TaxID=1121252 RepID=UPI00042335BB|nr:DEAD/DEAH box helicase [Cucumibacter marinus]